MFSKCQGRGLNCACAFVWTKNCVMWCVWIEQCVCSVHVCSLWMYVWQFVRTKNCRCGVCLRLNCVCVCGLNNVFVCVCVCVYVDFTVCVSVVCGKTGTD